MNQQILINSLDIIQLNKTIGTNILVTKDYLKKELLRKSFESRELISFKLFNEVEFKHYINISFDKEVEYIIYKKVKNYNLSKFIYENLDIFLCFYSYNKNISNNIFDDNNANLIMNTIKYLDEQGYVNNLYLNFEQHIYTLDVNLTYLNIEVINMKLNFKNETKKVEVLEFKNLEDEIFYTFNEISKLIKTKKVDIKKVKIYGSQNYKNMANVISNYFNLKLYEDNFYKLDDIKINNIIDQLQNISKKNMSKKAEDKEQFFSVEVYNFLNASINFLKEEEFAKFAHKKLKDIKVKKDKLDQCVEFLKIEEFDYSKDNYNFILGFNDYDFIKYIKDSGFLKKETINTLNLEDSVQKNKNKEEKVRTIIDFIKQANNNKISYSTDCLGETVQISNLIDIDEINIHNKSVADPQKRYSKVADIYNFKKYEYKQIQENKKYKELKTFNENLNEDDKKSIDFHMQGPIIWDKENFKENKNISATLLEKYYKCNFIFYTENILKVKKKTLNYSAMNIGIYIHGILELIVNEKNINKYLIDDEFNNNLLKEDIIKAQEEVLKKEENIFLNYKSKKNLIIYKLNTYLEDLINQIIVQISKENFKLFSAEENINMEFEQYNLVGKIDSVLKFKDYYIIVDYKTGSPQLDLDLEKLELGINLQNIIYYILLKYKYSNALLGGTYRLKVKPNIIRDKKENLALRNGYTLKESQVIQNIDFTNYSNLSLKKDGSYSATSKVLDEEELEKILEITNSKISSFIKDINTNVKYNINPLKKSVNACEYCNYFDICFKSSKDYKKE